MRDTRNDVFRKKGKYELDERVRGIEPLSLPWEGSIEPLNYTRIIRG